jgi:protein-tyrosine phosphatase
MSSEQPLPQRTLPLQAGHNFRDIGGYPVAGGGRVKWRHVYRSGVMARFTSDDIAYVNALGIDTICDLRSNDERRRHPTAWHEGTATELWARDYHFGLGSFDSMIKRQEITAADMRETMVTVYRDLPFEQSSSYRELFERLANGRVPLLFNCSAGKDRTGVASALLLDLLGVPRSIIEQDYLLTNDAIDVLVAHMQHDTAYGRFVTEQPAAAMPLLRAEAEYLREMFAAVDHRNGGTAGYFSQVLGLAADQQAAIRANLIG